MSVQCVHRIEGKSGNESMSMTYLHFWRLFMSMYIIRKCDKLAEMFIILSFKLDTQSWNVHNVPSPWTYWPLKQLTWFYFTIMICYILNHVPNKSIIVLAHLHTHTARNSSSLLYWPPHCFSYFFFLLYSLVVYIFIYSFSQSQPCQVLYSVPEILILGTLCSGVCVLMYIALHFHSLTLWLLCCIFTHLRLMKM